MSAILLLNSAMTAAFSANRRTLSRLAIQTEQSQQDGELENMAELDSVQNGTLEMQQPPSSSRDIASGFDAQRPLTTPACTTTVVVNVANKENYKRSDYVNLEECYDETAWIRVCTRLTATSSDAIPVVVPLLAVTHTLHTFPPAPNLDHGKQDGTQPLSCKNVAYQSHHPPHLTPGNHQGPMNRSTAPARERRLSENGREARKRTRPVAEDVTTMRE